MTRVIPSEVEGSPSDEQRRRPSEGDSSTSLGMTQKPMNVLMTADTVGGVWTYAMELTRALSDVRFTLATKPLAPLAGRGAGLDLRECGVRRPSSGLRPPSPRCGGEKGNSLSPLAPLAGRGWRAAPGEGPRHGERSR